MLSLTHWICYALFGAWVLFEINEESRDIFTNRNKEHPDADGFGDGFGQFIYWNKYQPGDTLNTLMEKSERLSNRQQYLPTWRRSLILALLLTVLLTIVVHKQMMPFPLFFLYIVIIFCVYYYSFNYYHYHYEKHGSANLDYNLKILARNLRSRKKESAELRALLKKGNFKVKSKKEK